MTEPWFSPETARWFAFLSLLAVLAALEAPARRGLYRTAVLTTAVAAVALGVSLFIAGVVALMSGQPRYVSGPLLLTGFVLSVTCAGGLHGIRKLYAEAELRKVTAADL
jgi:hypothetical protein